MSEIVSYDTCRLDKGFRQTNYAGKVRYLTEDLSRSTNWIAGPIEIEGEYIRATRKRWDGGGVKYFI